MMGIGGRLATRLALLERARCGSAMNDGDEPCHCTGRIYVVYEDEDGTGPGPMAPSPAKRALCRHGRPYARWDVLYADAEGDDDGAA